MRKIMVNQLGMLMSAGLIATVATIAMGDEGATTSPQNTNPQAVQSAPSSPSTTSPAAKPKKPDHKIILKKFKKTNEDQKAKEAPSDAGESR